MLRIKDELRHDGLEGCASVRTVDGYQGSESDVVIISCVRADPAAMGNTSGSWRRKKKGSIGFIAQSERLNVALTRARFALFVVGNFQSFGVSAQMYLQLVNT